LGAVDRAIELLTDVRDALDATEPGTEELTEFFTRGAPIVERASDGEASESEVSLDHANWAEQLLAIGATGSLVTGITVGADVAQGITVNVRGNM
jgi:hypothetical protein